MKLKCDLRSDLSKVINGILISRLLFEKWALNKWDRKNNNIGMLILIKVDGNSLTGAARSCHILAIPHQPTNELVNPESFTFYLRWQQQCSCKTSTDRCLHDFLKDERKRSSWSFVICECTSTVTIKTWSLSSRFGQIVMIPSFLVSRIMHIWTPQNKNDYLLDSNYVGIGFSFLCKDIQVLPKQVQLSLP
jgi:hypothetical protein